MKTIKFIDLIKESKTEFAIWGIPPGERDEQLLFTKAKTPKEAEKMKDILTKKHKCKNVRIQVIDFGSDISKD